MGEAERSRGFPISAGLLLGLGLGGFFDGIVFHQVLQWHHMLTSAGHPPDSVESLKLNTLADGLFHASTYALTGIGILILWRASRTAHRRWSGAELGGTVLMGFGTFNLVEGDRRPPDPRDPPRQRDGAPRAVDDLGHGVPGLGRADGGGGSGPAAARGATVPLKVLR
jgi:uncharacterized membrane protein